MMRRPLRTQTIPNRSRRPTPTNHYDWATGAARKPLASSPRSDAVQARHLHNAVLVLVRTARAYHLLPPSRRVLELRHGTRIGWCNLAPAISPNDNPPVTRRPTVTGKCESGPVCMPTWIRGTPRIRLAGPQNNGACRASPSLPGTVGLLGRSKQVLTCAISSYIKSLR